MKIIKNSLYNRRCFIIGNGASLNEMNLDLIKNEITIGCNKIYLAFIPTFLCVSDEGKFEELKGELEEIDTNFVFAFQHPEKIVMSEKLRNKSHIVKLNIGKRKDWAELLEVDSFPHDEEFKETYCGRGVVFDLCYPLAYFLGIKEIYLIGMDGFVNGEYKHFYGGEVIRHPEVDITEYHEKIKYLCKKEGIKIYNCTLNTHYNYFEKKDYLEVVKEKK